MLTAKKSFWFEKIFAVYNRNLIKCRFHAFRVSGLSELQKRNSKAPLIIYANHSAWWDGLVAFEIWRRAALDAFVMMEEKQLKKLFLFRRLGAFSVVRENARQAVESIRYAADILNEKPSRALWIFPQGKITPNDARPIIFYNGLSRIIEKTRRAEILPVAFRYEFAGDFKPEIFVKIGKIESIDATENFNSKRATAVFADKLTKLLGELKDETTNENFDDYERII